MRLWIRYLPPRSTRVLAYARQRVGETAACRRYAQKTSSRDLHNTDLYLKVTRHGTISRLSHARIAFNAARFRGFHGSFLPFAGDTVS